MRSLGFWQICWRFQILFDRTLFDIHKCNVLKLFRKSKGSFQDHSLEIFLPLTWYSLGFIFSLKIKKVPGNNSKSVALGYSSHDWSSSAKKSCFSQLEENRHREMITVTLNLNHSSINPSFLTRRDLKEGFVEPCAMWISGKKCSVLLKRIVIYFYINYLISSSKE